MALELRFAVAWVQAQAPCGRKKIRPRAPAPADRVGGEVRVRKVPGGAEQKPWFLVRPESVFRRKTRDRRTRGRAETEFLLSPGAQQRAMSEPAGREPCRGERHGRGRVPPPRATSEGMMEGVDCASSAIHSR